jgi:hypothetical protein
MRRTRACRSVLCVVFEASSDSESIVVAARDFSGDAFGVTKRPGEDRRDRGLATGDCDDDGLLLCADLAIGLRGLFLTGMSSSSSLLTMVTAAGALGSLLVAT